MSKQATTVDFGNARVLYDPWSGRVSETSVFVGGVYSGFITEKIDDPSDRPYPEDVDRGRFVLHLDRWQIVDGRYSPSVPRFHSSMQSAMDAARAELGAN